MISFICGAESAEKSEHILKRIADSAASGRRVTVIVPEQQAVVWERRLARTLDPRASLNLDVVSFTRLANLVERRFGGLSYDYADRGARTLLMWKAISAVAPVLRVYGDVRNTASLVSSMQSLQSEFARCGVTPADLENCADSLDSDGETSLADRLRDVAVIMAEYSASFTEGFDDPGGEPDKLLEMLREHDFFDGSDVYIDSFYSLTGVEMKIVSRIFAQAENTTVSFACSPTPTESEPHLSHIYSFLYKMKESASAYGGAKVETIDSANEENADAESTANAENERTSKERELIRRALWDFSAPIPTIPDGDPYLRVIRCADRYEEAEAALSRVQQLVRSGARYSDIAVIARSTEPHVGIIDAVFADAGIPLSVSTRFSLASSPAVTLAASVLGAIRSNFAREDVTAILSTGLCNVSAEEAGAFARYTEIWGINSRTAYYNGDWTMNPDGYSAIVSDRGRRELGLANSAKAKIEAAMSPLVEVFDGKPTAEAVLRALWKTLSDFGAYNALRTRALSLDGLGLRDAAAFAMRSWDELCESCDTFARVLGGMTVDITSFTSLFRQVISSRDVGVIPSGIDEVTFGAADRLRADPISHVIIIGAIEGEFPKDPEGSGLFTDTDRVRMEGAGLILSDSGEDRASKELFWFWRAATLAEKSLDLIIPATDENKKKEPSSGARRLLELIPDAPVRYYSSANAEDALWQSKDIARFYLSAKSEDESDPALAAALTGIVPDLAGIDATDLPVGMWSSVSADLSEMIFGKRLNLTQARLESYVKCAFSFYGRYVLDLDDRTETRLAPSDVGNFVHAILEKYLSSGDVWTLTEDENLALVRDLTADYVESVFGKRLTPRMTYLTKRLERSILLYCRMMREEFAQSEFRPFALEQKIGMGDDTPPELDIPIPGGASVAVRGIIDRLDVYRRGDEAFIRVVDYKTGAKSFSPKDLPLALNTQLFLYLFAIWKCPDCDFRRRLLGSASQIVPAGVMYLSARPGEAASDRLVDEDEARSFAEDSAKRSGRFLANEEVLRAMEGDLAGRFIPVTLKKDGTFRGDNVIDLAGFSALHDEITTAVAAVAKRMTDGKTDALPLKHGGVLPCDFCRLKPICRNTEGKCRYR